MDFDTQTALQKLEILSTASLYRDSQPVEVIEVHLLLLFCKDDRLFSAKTPRVPEYSVDR